MEEKVKWYDLLKPILKLSPTLQEIQTLEDLHPDVGYLLMKAIDLSKSARYEDCLVILQAIQDVTWEQLNTGHWSVVPESQRNLYAAISLFKVVTLSHMAVQGSMTHMEKAVQTADMGLLLGNSYREQLTTAAHILSQAINQCKSTPVVRESCLSSASEAVPQLQVPTEPVSQLHRPSLETFSAQHFYPRVPVKITGCMTHWPALRLWSDLDYLLTVAGSRTVPVELGSSYSHADWSQRLMSLHQFVTQHVKGSDDKGVGYLAQHHLFDQVPELRKDITVPEYCACSEDEMEAEIDINAWFGPCGTVSPLHYDPKHNLLCQVVGSKQVTLYSPAVSDHLYPHDGRLLSNTARVDPEAPDYRQFPLYRETQGLLCTLSPGDMVYIPPQWWHHVRALSLSFSVSFWWK